MDERERFDARRFETRTSSGVTVVEAVAGGRLSDEDAILGWRDLESYERGTVSIGLTTVMEKLCGPICSELLLLNVRSADIQTHPNQINLHVVIEQTRSGPYKNVAARHIIAWMK